MRYPEEVLVTGAGGRKEARVLRSMGEDFVTYGYADPETGKAYPKYSIVVRKKNMEIEHWFVVPTRNGKELIVKHNIEANPSKRAIFDALSGKTVWF
jgi:hypothetical protein